MICSNGRRRSKVQTLSIAMTCEKTIAAIEAYFMVGSLFSGKPHFPGVKPLFRWKVTCRKARFVLEKLQPYLITKSEHAILVLAHKIGKGGRPKASPKV